MILAVLACVASVATDKPTGDSARDTGAPPVDDTGGDTGATDSADTNTGTDSGTDSDTDTASDRAAEVCARWAADRADTSEGRWTGDVGTCNAGEMATSARENALRLTNLYRWMAGQPAVTDDASRNAAAQECALMEHVHGSLSHTPDPSWDCYTADGDEAAGSSNIASAPAVYAVDMYMLDWGNETTIGHRRWLLSNQLGPVGVGSTDRYSCMWVLYGSGTASARWVAWPPPGPVPVEAFFDDTSNGVDKTGWTLQSDSIDLSRASVTVTAGGADQPVTVTALEQYYGSTWAVKFTPRGWRVAAGTTYSVAVTGTSPEIRYDVEVVDCGGGERSVSNSARARCASRRSRRGTGAHHPGGSRAACQGNAVRYGRSHAGSCWTTPTSPRLDRLTRPTSTSRAVGTCPD